MFGPQQQSEIYLRGVGGDRPIVPVRPAELEARAANAMSREAAAYVVGGAGSEHTADANRAAFRARTIVPRVLRDVERRDASVTLFGDRLSAPLLTAPIGVLELVHKQADLAVARACAAEGVPMVFSNQASVAMEACAAALGHTPRWFQLYWSRSDAVVRSFVSRAEACGCRAIVLTLDTTMLGWRPRDLDLAYLPFLRGMGIAQYVSDPAFLAELDLPIAVPTLKPRTTPHAIGVLRDLFRNTPGALGDKLRTGWPRKAVQRFVSTYSRPSLTWNDIATLRRMTSLPIVLKGVLHADDARLAVEHGVDGVIVSNHGGRQIDGAIATLDALPGVVRAIGGQMPALLDSGVRSGADVFKAVALGATAVLLGRPYVYGLALAGEAGVREVLRSVRAEFDLTMGLAGCTTIADITPAMLASE